MGRSQMSDSVRVAQIYSFVTPPRLPGDQGPLDFRQGLVGHSRLRTDGWDGGRGGNDETGTVTGRVAETLPQGS